MKKTFFALTSALAILALAFLVDPARVVHAQNFACGGCVTVTDWSCVGCHYNCYFSTAGMNGACVQCIDDEALDCAYTGPPIINGKTTARERKALMAAWVKSTFDAFPSRIRKGQIAYLRPGTHGKPLPANHTVENERKWEGQCSKFATDPLAPRTTKE